MPRHRDYTRLAAEQAASLATRPDLSIFDARDAVAFARGHLAGARPLDGSNYERILLAEPKGRPVLIYCYHGNASRTYAQMFVDFGFEEVYDLIGGYTAWEAWLAARDSSRGAPFSPPLRAWLEAEGFDPDAPDPRIANRASPLMHACRQGRADMVEALLAARVPLDACNGDGNNALWVACVQGDSALVQRLIDAGVPVNRQNDNGATCLMYAASAGKAGLVATLLAAGADPELRSLDDYSALDMAATLECLRLLRPARRRAA